MTLDYFSLLSYEPYYMPKVGYIKSPLLSEVSKITFPIYEMYLNILLLNIDTYFKSFSNINEFQRKVYTQDELAVLAELQNQYRAMSPDEQNKILFFDIVHYDKLMLNTLLEAFRFFIKADIQYNADHRIFILYNDMDSNNIDRPITGIINKDNFNLITNVILQRNGIGNKNSNAQIFKNKKAAELQARIDKANSKKKTTDSSKMELANIISSLATRHNSINMMNIWNLTVYQVYDQFKRQRFLDSYEIQSMNVAVLGNSENRFNESQWFELIN